MRTLKHSMTPLAAIVAGSLATDLSAHLACGAGTGAAFSLLVKIL